ncbi:MAG: hypothetical protein R2788_04165 [Saprospiraceae bacterium]
MIRHKILPSSTTTSTIPFDLSKVLFVTTANQLDTIPPPLLDRMEVIRLSGYILEEKVQIAKKYLIPRQLKEHGFKANDVKFKDAAVKMIADKYAREAGRCGIWKNRSERSSAK